MSDISRELPLEALRLRGFRAEHPVGSHDCNRAVLGSAFGVAICAAMMFVATQAKDPSTLYTAALVLVRPGLVFGGLLVTHLRRRVRLVLLFDRGFVVDHGSSAASFPWDEIESVRESRTEVVTALSGSSLR